MSYQLSKEPPLDPPEPEIALYCDCCGIEIYVGEDYYDIESCVICSECLGEWMDEHYRKEAEIEPDDGPDPDEAYDRWRDRKMEEEWQ